MALAVVSEYESKPANFLANIVDHRFWEVAKAERKSAARYLS